MYINEYTYAYIIWKRIHKKFNNSSSFWKGSKKVFYYLLLCIVGFFFFLAFSCATVLIRNY